MSFRRWTRTIDGYYRDGYFIHPQVVNMRQPGAKRFRRERVWVLWRPIQRGPRKGELDTIGWDGTRRTPPIYFRHLAQCKRFAERIVAGDPHPWVGA